MSGMIDNGMRTSRFHATEGFSPQKGARLKRFILLVTAILTVLTLTGVEGASAHNSHKAFQKGLAERGDWDNSASEIDISGRTAIYSGYTSVTEIAVNIGWDELEVSSDDDYKWGKLRSLLDSAQTQGFDHVRLRILSGCNAPDWLKTGTGSLGNFTYDLCSEAVSLNDTETTLVKFWKPGGGTSIVDHYYDMLSDMASADCDKNTGGVQACDDFSVLSEIQVCALGTTYCEPFIRATDSSTSPAYDRCTDLTNGTGYTVSADVNRQFEQAGEVPDTALAKTRFSLAASTFQTCNESTGAFLGNWAFYNILQGMGHTSIGSCGPLWSDPCDARLAFTHAMVDDFTEYTGSAVNLHRVITNQNLDTDDVGGGTNCWDGIDSSSEPIKYVRETLQPLGTQISWQIAKNSEVSNGINELVDFAHECTGDGLVELPWDYGAAYNSSTGTGYGSGASPEYTTSAASSDNTALGG